MIKIYLYKTDKTFQLYFKQNFNLLYEEKTIVDDSEVKLLKKHTILILPPQRKLLINEKIFDDINREVIIINFENFIKKSIIENLNIKSFKLSTPAEIIQKSILLNTQSKISKDTLNLDIDASLYAVKQINNIAKNVYNKSDTKKDSKDSQIANFTNIFLKTFSNKDIEENSNINILKYVQFFMDLLEHQLNEQRIELTVKKGSTVTTETMKGANLSLLFKALIRFTIFFEIKKQSNQLSNFNKIEIEINSKAKKSVILLSFKEKSQTNEIHRLVYSDEFKNYAYSVAILLKKIDNLNFKVLELEDGISLYFDFQTIC